MKTKKYSKNGGSSLIDGVRISKAMILEIGKENKTQDLSKDDIEAIKALPLFKRELERKKQWEKQLEEMKAEQLKRNAEIEKSRIERSERCKKDLLNYLPILKKLSSELGMEKVFLSGVPHPEGCYTDADIDIEKFCRYAGKKAVEILTEKLLDCYIGVTGDFDESNEKFFCSDELRDIYGWL